MNGTINIKEHLAKGLVVAGKVALTIIPDVSRAGMFIDRCTGAQIERRLWRTRLEQSRILLELLVGEPCEREAHETEPILPDHQAKCILCYAHEVLEQDNAPLAELIDATEQVLCRIDDCSIVDEAGTKLDFTGLGEALMFWGRMD